MSNSARLQSGAASAGVWVRALRPSHWIKNLLLVAPPIFGQSEPTPQLFADLLAGVVICSCAASAGYLLNDVLDRTADRQHATKRFRPIAAGMIAPLPATLLALSLGLAALIGTVALFPPAVALLVVLYLLATIAYSSFFKRLAVIDVIVLAGLYAWRLLMGGAVSEVVVSGWLLVVGYGLFVALALAKRLDEVAALTASGKGIVPGRAYGRHDLPRLRLAAWSSAGLSIATLAAYIAFSSAADQYYRNQLWLWASALLVCVWLAHILLRATHGRLRGDPVLFAATDPASLLLAAGVVVTLIAAV